MRERESNIGNGNRPLLQGGRDEPFAEGHEEKTCSAPRLLLCRKTELANDARGRILIPSRWDLQQGETSDPNGGGSTASPQTPPTPRAGREGPARRAAPWGKEALTLHLEVHGLRVLADGVAGRAHVLARVRVLDVLEGERGDASVAADDDPPVQGLPEGAEHGHSPSRTLPGQLRELAQTLPHTNPAVLGESPRQVRAREETPRGCSPPQKKGKM